MEAAIGMNKGLNLWALFCLLLILASSSFPQAVAGGQEKAAPKNSREEKPTFKLVRIGQTKAGDGTSMSFRDYDASDGTKLSVIYGRFASPEKARNELQDWLKTAKVQESAPLKDKLGQITGQRFVLVIHNNSAPQDAFAIVWTQGPDAWWIGCTSLSVALMFERKMKDSWAESDSSLPGPR